MLLVRRFADLAGVNEALAPYLSVVRRRSPGRALEVIQGIWIDDEGVANPPSALVLRDAAGAPRTVRIPETTGINGIWMLCWLEATARTVPRIELVAALLERFGHQEAATDTLAARFIPVFPGGSSERSVVHEAHALELRYPGLVLPPLYLDDNGGLRLLQAQPHVGLMPS